MSTQVHPYSRRITGAELPAEEKSILIVRYKVIDRGNRDYEISLKDLQDPFVPINTFIQENGTITPKMAQLMETPTDTTVVITPFDFYEGLRIFQWRFDYGGRKRHLLLDRTPWDGWDKAPYFHRGLLLGSIAEGDGRLKIPDVPYFVQSTYGLFANNENLWGMQLYLQPRGLIISSGVYVNRIAKFLLPPNPDEQWVRSEVERFERNGENLSDEKVIELYEELSRSVWNTNGYIMSNDILAFPSLSSLQLEYASSLGRNRENYLKTLRRKLGRQ